MNLASGIATGVTTTPALTSTLGVATSGLTDVVLGGGIRIYTADGGLRGELPSSVGSLSSFGVATGPVTIFTVASTYHSATDGGPQANWSSQIDVISGIPTCFE